MRFSVKDGFIFLRQHAAQHICDTYTFRTILINFFLMVVTSTSRIAPPIFTVDGSNDEKRPKDMPFGESDHQQILFGGFPKKFHRPYASEIQLH
jgi:hypothetical protein